MPRRRRRHRTQKIGQQIISLVSLSEMRTRTRNKTYTNSHKRTLMSQGLAGHHFKPMSTHKWLVGCFFRELIAFNHFNRIGAEPIGRLGLVE